jgi:hypothetical protein
MTVWQRQERPGAGDDVSDGETQPAGRSCQPAGRGGGVIAAVRRAAGAGRWAALWALAGVLLFLCYWRQSWTAPVNSDGASQVLQAWAMLHGNLLLHGWNLSDVSFYTTELPEYMLVEAVRGLSPSVVHIASALNYTLAVLLAALLAKGRATGREGLVRALIAGGIMLAPQLGIGNFILLLSPDHFGTAVPVLLILLVLDRARHRWYVPVVVGVLLTWVLVADQVTVFLCVVPIVVTCAVRAYQGLVRRSESPAAQWYELSLGAAALVSVGVASVIVKVIHEHGGYTVQPLTLYFSGIATIPAHTWQALQGLLEIFGANFFGQLVGVHTLFDIGHLVGFALFVWALCLGVRGFLGSQDLLAQLLTVSIIGTLAAYVLDYASGTGNTHEVAALLPLGSVLAGRVLARHVIADKLVPLLAFTLACYALILASSVLQPTVTAENTDLAIWLGQHHLSSGLGGYWQANSETLDSGNRIPIRSVSMWHGQVRSSIPWESQVSWYNPHLHDANFLVTVSHPWAERIRVTEQAAIQTFGPPEQTYHYRRYTIMVWDKNLLTHLRPMPIPPPPGS